MSLTEAQLDGRACLRCGREDGLMGPVGELRGVQVFAHHVCPTPAQPPVPPEYEAIAAQLDAHAHTLRELGRYGAKALGEGEDLSGALWDLANELGQRELEVDDLADKWAAREERERAEQAP